MCDGVYAVVVLCSVEWCSEEVVAPTHYLCCVYVCMCVCVCVCVCVYVCVCVRVEEHSAAYA